MVIARTSLAWLRKHYPTTKGMDAPDYVVVNRFVDGALRRGAEMAAAVKPVGPLDYQYAMAWGAIQSELFRMANEVPGVIEWMNAHTVPAPWEERR